MADEAAGGVPALTSARRAGGTGRGASGSSGGRPRSGRPIGPARGPKLGAIETLLTDERRVILTTTPVYARPTVRSFDWARLRRGLWVRCERRQAGFAHVTYAEWDRQDRPSYVSYQITGWVPEAALAGVERRHFFLLTVAGPTPEHWEVDDDGHRFSLFWAPLASLPAVGSIQGGWLAMLPEEFRR